MTIRLNRREVSAGILAAAAGIAPRMARAAEGQNDRPHVRRLRL